MLVHNLAPWQMVGWEREVIQPDLTRLPSKAELHTACEQGSFCFIENSTKDNNIISSKLYIN